MRKERTYKEKKSELPASKFTKSGLKGGGWNNDGIKEYNELYHKIIANRRSAAGKRFNKEFHQKMKEAHDKKSVAAKKRKAAAVEVVVLNDMSSDSEDDEQTARTG